jgi:hypothetical protein
VLGLAGLAGVAASGVVLARAERRRQALSPDEVRARLHARHAAASAGGPVADPQPPAAPTARAGVWQRLRARRSGRSTRSGAGR